MVQNSYQLWAKDNRQAVKDAGFKGNDVQKELGRR